MNLPTVVVVDNEAGVVSANADADILAYYQQHMRVLDECQARLRYLIKEPSLSVDGTPVSLLGNLDFPEATVAIRTNGAVGVGLYRTEFLYTNRDYPPDEEEHLAAHLEVIRGLEGAPVMIRTLDLGGGQTGRRQLGYLLARL